jgi:hypothetical protein
LWAHLHICTPLHSAHDLQISSHIATFALLEVDVHALPTCTHREGIGAPAQQHLRSGTAAGMVQRCATLAVGNVYVGTTLYQEPNNSKLVLRR